MTRKAPFISVLLLLMPCPAVAQGLQDWPSLSWAMCKDLEDVRALFPHPTDPLTMWVVTADGLHKTVDDGLTWKVVPSATNEKMGLVTALTVCPADENRILLGTQDRGLFLSADGGTAWKPLGSETEKLASATIAAAGFSNIDPSWRTVMVTHGASAPGMSFSRDLGKTWEILAQDRFLGAFAQSGDTLVAAGSMVQSEGKVWGIHRSGFYGLRWEEVNRGLPVGEPAVTLLRPDHFYFGTLDGRILESTDDGDGWSPIVRSDSAKWVSLFVTHGRADNVEILAGYDPYRRGVVLSSGRMRTGTQRAENKGLYVGSFVKSGAACRANANGTTYYVGLNNSLWIARRTRTRPEGPMVLQARCLPSALWTETNVLGNAQAAIHGAIERLAAGSANESAVAEIARASRTYDQRKAGLTLAIQARVEHPKGLSAIKVATADLTVIGGKPDVELFDDGRHGDGAAGDGLYAATVQFLPTGFDRLPERDRRWPLPGVTSLTVTAIDRAGLSDSWSAVLSVQRKCEPVGIHPLAISYRFGSHIVEGPVTLHEDGAQAMIQQHAALCFTVSKPGAWRAAKIAGSGVNISGCDYLTFYVKGDVNQDLYVALVDRIQVDEDLVDVPHFSRPVHLISGGYLKAITPKYQQVTIPIGELLPKGTYFLPRHAAGIGLGADADGKPGKYFIDLAYTRP